jgi:hypothetical protein
MLIKEIASRPKLVKLHYFSVDDVSVAEKIGLKKDRHGQWYLPQYNTSGSGFDKNAGSAIRLFGLPKTVKLN